MFSYFSGGHGAWNYAESEILWSQRGVGHCIVFTPAHVFEPEHGCVGSIAIPPKVGSKRGLSCTRKQVMKYYGTYQCTRVETIDFCVIAKINGEVRLSHTLLLI